MPDVEADVPTVVGARYGRPPLLDAYAAWECLAALGRGDPLPYWDRIPHPAEALLADGLIDVPFGGGVAITDRGRAHLAATSAGFAAGARASAPPAACGPNPAGPGSVSPGTGTGFTPPTASAASRGGSIPVAS